MPDSSNRGCSRTHLVEAESQARGANMAEVAVKIRIAATPRSALDATLHAACYRPVSIATLAEAYLHPMASECFWWLKQ